jgi:hypothetical protein
MRCGLQVDSERRALAAASSVLFLLLGVVEQEPRGGARYGCLGKRKKTEELVATLKDFFADDIRTSFFIGNCGSSDGE